MRQPSLNPYPPVAARILLRVPIPQLKPVATGSPLCLRRISLRTQTAGSRLGRRTFTHFTASGDVSPVAPSTTVLCFPKEESGVSEIQVERGDQGVATVWLDNPAHLNALSNSMIIGLCEEMPRLAD